MAADYMQRPSSVFDVLGREVAVLVDEMKPAGAYKAT